MTLDALQAATRARVALGRAGDALPTREVLRFAADHALARDAVHDALDVPLLQQQLGDLGPARVVASAAPDRATYLQRPDLGRVLSHGTELEPEDVDLVVVLADGLSARATTAHAVALTRAVLDGLEGWTTSLVIATQARVALGDPIAEALGARCALVLLGERPGLSAPDSLGAYLTWMPRPGRRDSERNCVSNIRPPHGLATDAAARTLVGLLVAARHLQLSGVQLKDELPVLPS
jgi:ethanolamine ammonia-lyase small subunit